MTFLSPINFAKAFHRSAVCKIISSRKNAQYSAWNTHGTTKIKICMVHICTIHLFSAICHFLFILFYVPPTLSNEQTNSCFWWKQRYTLHIVRNLIWLKKNRASDNEGKFHSFLMYRIWIYSQNLIWHQIMVAFGTFLENWAISLFSSTSALAATRCCLYWSI